jgi:nicotinamidase-related amidase
MTSGQARELPALLVIDMVKDTLEPARELPITRDARAVTDSINHIADWFRDRGWPVVFATDAFEPNDFLFQGKMKPHSLAGTTGAQVTDLLPLADEDLWLPKPRFSAFFGTRLADWLRDRSVSLCAVSGIATNFCVLATALDAVCHDFRTVVLEDCSAASSQRIHAQTLELYRDNPLYPLLRIDTSGGLLEELLN